MRIEKEYLRRLLTDKSESRNVVQILSELEWDRITSVELGFDDASVPPRCHRSYSMIFTADSVKVNIVSYGRLLAAFMTMIPYGKYVELKSVLKEQNIRRVESVDIGLCGGSGGYITLKRWEEVLFSAHISGNKMVSEGNLAFDGFLFDAAYKVFPWLENTINEMVEHLEGIDPSCR